LWNFNWLSGRCSEVYECLKNAVGLQKTARNCKQSGRWNRVSSEETHAVCHFEIGGSALVIHRRAPSLHCFAVDGRNCNRESRVLYTRPLRGVSGQWSVVSGKIQSPRRVSGQFSSAEMLEDLTRDVSRKVAASARWPKTPRALSNELRRIAPALRARGIDVGFGRTRDRRLITISRCPRSGFSSATRKSCLQIGMG
jgi:hypothetical protein